MNVINWIKGTQVCRNLRLTNILYSITNVLESYDTFSCRHVYGEINKEVDKASKEGLLLTLGQWKIKEQVDGAAHDFTTDPSLKGLLSFDTLML